MQTKHSPLSMGVHVRRVPLQRHPHCSTRFRNANARKSKQKKDLWFQRKKVMVHSTMFQTLPNIQMRNGVNWCRKTIRHGTIQTPCHYNPPLNSCQQNSGSSTTVRQRNQTTSQKKAPMDGLVAIELLRKVLLLERKEKLPPHSVQVSKARNDVIDPETYSSNPVRRSK